MTARPPLPAVIAYNEFGAYCVPLSSQHRPAAQMILRGEVYEPHTVAFLRENCGTGDVIHAGTYFGDFLPGVSAALAPGAKLWAWEPSQENYRCAEITTLLNRLGNVELAHAGLGAEASTRQLLTADPDGRPRGGSSRVLAPGETATGAVEGIRIDTIDEWVPADRTAAIIQLDVEGHEEQALMGAMATIRRCRPILMLETLADSTLPTSAWFAASILGDGYTFRGSIHGNAVFQHRG